MGHTFKSVMMSSVIEIINHRMMIVMFDNLAKRLSKRFTLQDSPILITMPIHEFVVFKRNFSIQNRK